MSLAQYPFGMKGLTSFFLILIFLSGNSFAASPCFIAVTGDSMSRGPTFCELSVNQEAVTEGTDVKVTIRLNGKVVSAMLEGKRIGPSGGTVAVRMDRSRVLVGYVEGPLGFSTCHARVAVIQNQERGRSENFIRMTASNEEMPATEVTVLPENSICNLGSTACLVRVTGGVAALVSSSNVVGWKCNDRFFSSLILGRGAVTSLNVNEDLSCEAVFDRRTL